jgi:hypothetical protein
MLGFATLWWPSLDPFGPTLVAAVVVVAMTWVLAELPATLRVRAPLLVTGLLLFSALLVVFPADLIALSPFHLYVKGRRFPGFSDYLANYLLLGAAMVFALKLARVRRPWWQEIGIISSALFGVVVLAELCGTLYYRYEG